LDDLVGFRTFGAQKSVENLKDNHAENLCYSHHLRMLSFRVWVLSFRAPLLSKGIWVLSYRRGALTRVLYIYIVAYPTERGEAESFLNSPCLQGQGEKTYGKLS